MPLPTIQEQFGQIDIYLFDQLLKGRIARGMRILDAGCGSGRNLIYLLREGYEVSAVDEDPQAVESVRSLARRLAPELPASNFRVEPVEHMSFSKACADVVISNTVLHFARDDAHFESMLWGSWRVLKPGGLFFCRLGSTIGMESQVEPIQGRRYRSPDGAERYLVDEALLGSAAARLGGELADPLKTTVVQNQRSMTTWVLRKNLVKIPSRSSILS
jgi:tellurite methyltransferase